MSPQLMLSRSDLTALMTPRDYLAAAEDAFRALAGGRASSVAPLHVEAENGVFHAKAGTYRNQHSYLALKLNANFPGNPDRAGLPTIQGAMLLCDADNGALLCILDSAEVTLQRTAAASALAARRLAPANSRTLLLCGCGVQALAHAQALADIFPLAEIFCWDRDSAKAEALARILAHGAHSSALTELPAAGADIVVTSTTATAPFLNIAHVRPGAFVAAVGADNPAKSEIAPALMARAAIVCDSKAQCAAMGDLHHALEAGAVSLHQVRAELAEIVAGAKPGRMCAEEIVVFDSTGLAVQDAAAASMAYRRALQEGRGKRCALHE